MLLILLAMDFDRFQILFHFVSYFVFKNIICFILFHILFSKS